MDIQEHARRLLEAYGRAEGLPDLRFNAQGCARLVFGDDATVNLEIDKASGLLLMYGVLGSIPAGNREELYRSLLEANLLGVHSAGASLAVDGLREEVLLCLRIAPAGVGSYDFGELIESFAHTLAYWLQRWRSGEILRSGAQRSRDQLSLFLQAGV